MVLDEADDVVLFGELDELDVVLEKLHGWLCNEDVEPPLDGVLCDGIMGA